MTGSLGVWACGVHDPETTELVIWLRVRLDEREATANGVLGNNAEARGRGLDSTLWDDEDAEAEIALVAVDAVHRVLDMLGATDDADVFRALRQVARLLALPHAYRDDYRDEWRPPLGADFGPQT